MFTPKRILVPMDFSDEAQLAMDWAVMLAKQITGGIVHPTYVYSVIPDLVAFDVGRSDYKTVTELWIKEQMESLQKKLPKEVTCIPFYATGNPAEEISEICRVKGIDLIVMTTHGRKGISHLIHPSVAEALVHNAPCPVLVLHMNRTAFEVVHGNIDAQTTKK